MAEETQQTPNALGKMLHRAVRENDRGAALEALDHGADANWTNPSTATTALHIACKLGHTKIALVLLQRGADVNAQTKTGWIPMHFAVNTGLLDLVELLNSHGGRADIVNEWMKTPIDIAKERHNEEMLEILKRRPGTTVPRAIARAPSASLPKIPEAKSLEISANSVIIMPKSDPVKSANSPAIPTKSPRAGMLLAPTQEAPLPPTSKPLPQTPASGTDWADGSNGALQSSQGAITKVTKVTSGSLSGPSSNKAQELEIARLNKEVQVLKAEVDLLKSQMATVLGMLDSKMMNDL